MRTPQGVPVGESLAIAETLAEDHPHLWPSDPAQRATARWLCAEMTSSFRALRNDCPMQLMRCYQGFTPSDAVLADLDRIETLWSHARGLSGSTDGWLFGDYSLADVFYTPVAARIVGYGLPVSEQALRYCFKLLSDPAVTAWRREGLKVSYSPEPYRLDLPSGEWPCE